MHDAGLYESFEDFFEDPDFHIALLSSRNPLSKEDYEGICGEYDCEPLSLDDLENPDQCDFAEAMKSYVDCDDWQELLDVLEDGALDSMDLITPHVDGVGEALDFSRE